MSEEEAHWEKRLNQLAVFQLENMTTRLLSPNHIHLPAHTYLLTIAIYSSFLISRSASRTTSLISSLVMKSTLKLSRN